VIKKVNIDIGFNRVKRVLVLIYHIECNSVFTKNEKIRSIVFHLWKGICELALLTETLRRSMFFQVIKKLL